MCFRCTFCNARRGHQEAAKREEGWIKRVERLDKHMTESRRCLKLFASESLCNGMVNEHSSLSTFGQCRVIHFVTLAEFMLTLLYADLRKALMSKSRLPCKYASMNWQCFTRSYSVQPMLHFFPRRRNRREYMWPRKYAAKVNWISWFLHLLNAFAVLSFKIAYNVRRAYNEFTTCACVWLMHTS